MSAYVNVTLPVEVASTIRDILVAVAHQAEIDYADHPERYTVTPDDNARSERTIRIATQAITVALMDRDRDLARVK